MMDTDIRNDEFETYAYGKGLSRFGHKYDYFGVAQDAWQACEKIKDAEIDRLQAIVDGFTEPSEKTISKICHAFWRRIYQYKDIYTSELPTPTPVEFIAHMGTALTWLKLDAEKDDPRPPTKGHDDLWAYFGLSYSTWITLPRVLMHDMSDEWQEKMAALLAEWDNTWRTHHMPSPYVIARKGNKFVKWPKFLLNYRYPDQKEIRKIRESRR